MRSTSRFANAVVLLVGLVGACSSPAPETLTRQPPHIPETTVTVTTPASPPSTTTTSPTTTAATAETTTTELQARAYYERPCSSRVSEGYGGANSDLSILDIGPVALLAFDADWLETHTYYMEPTSDGEYEGIKFVIVIDHAAVGPVAVSISEPDRDHVRLVYDPQRRTPVSWEAADHTVKFEVCSDVDAQFNGGFVVNTPTCARIVVVDEGVPGSESSKSIPFGVPANGCMAAD